MILAAFDLPATRRRRSDWERAATRLHGV